MSAYSSRQKYDQQAIVEATERSTGVGNYYLNPENGFNCNTCFPLYGPLGGTRGAATTPGHVIDVDSILRGYTKIHSKSNEQQIPDSLAGYELFMPADCSPFVETEYSRFTNPVQNYRGLTRDPFYELNQDPQCNIFWNFEQNTQLAARDNHITDWRIPISQRDLLPITKISSRRDCSNNLGCSYAPYEPRELKKYDYYTRNN